MIFEASTGVSLACFEVATSVYLIKLKSSRLPTTRNTLKFIKVFVKLLENL